jgi:quercetin dioxygenase-like cupin family protein
MMPPKNRDASRRHAGRVRAAAIMPHSWGREVRYAQEAHYTAAILEMASGHGTTPHQESSARTIHMLSGLVWFQLNGIEFELIPGACLTIRPNDSYAIHAIEDSVLLEVRSTQLNDEVRVQEG